MPIAFRISLLLVLLTLSAHASETKTKLVPNPEFQSWSGFKVGATLTVDSTADAAGATESVRSVYTLPETTPDKVVLAVTTKRSLGNAKPVESIATITHNSTIPSDEIVANRPDTKSTPLPDVTLKFNGKSYLCKHTRLETTLESNGKKRVITREFLTHDDIPGGLAKLEIKDPPSPPSLGSKSTLLVREFKAEKIPVNPAYTAWASFPVGSAVTYKEITLGDGASTGESSQTLLELTPEKATIESSARSILPDGTKANGGTGKTVIPFAPPPSLNNAKVLKSGEETLKIGDQSYKCKFTVTLIQNTLGSRNRATTLKVWTSDEVPGGLVKSEAKAEAVPQFKMAETTVTKTLNEMKIPASSPKEN